MVKRLVTLCSCIVLLQAALPGFAQDSEPQTEAEQVLEEVRVVGSRFVKQALTDIEPEIRLSTDDVQAYGVNTLEELIAELGPELSSGRGRGDGGPVFLVDGVRIGSFREIRSYPPEAIERMDVLPEEAALKFGYGANQRVVNIVLKPEFTSKTLEAELGGPVSGAGFEQEYDGTYLKLFNSRRFSLDGEIETNAGILESDRGLDLFDQSGADSLTPETSSLELSGSYHRPFDNNVRMTVTGTLDASESESLLGLAEVDFILPSGSPFSSETGDMKFSRLVGVPGVLMSQSETIDGSLSLGLTTDIGDWFITSNTTISRSESTGTTDREPDASAFQQALLAFDPDVDPNSDLTPYLTYRSEDTERVSNSASTNLLANGRLFELPAGEVSTGLNLDLSHMDRTSRTVFDGEVTETELDRQIVKVQGSFDIPLISDDMNITGIHKLSANISATASEYSDFGQLFGFDGTINWSPVEPLRLLASYTLEEGAPSMSQLGDTLSTTPNVEVFDFIQGESVEVTTLSGGNPDLKADTRHVMKLSAELKPLEESDLNLNLTYLDSRIDDPIGSIPSVDAAVQAAFPDRFMRDEDGRLISYDLRPLNFVEETKRNLSWRLSWRKTFEQEKPQRPAEAGRARGSGEGQSGASPARRGPPPGMRGRGGRGAPDAMRVYVSALQTWNLEDQRILADGYPVQDYLNGAASGSGGGTPEFEFELRSGFYYKSFGARLGYSWQGDTEVTSGSTGTLRFSDLSQTELRLFYSVKPSSPLAQDVSFLSGARISLEIENMFDNVREVRDSNGVIPFNYHPDRLNPEGRTVYLSIRKQF